MSTKDKTPPLDETFLVEERDELATGDTVLDGSPTNAGIGPPPAAPPEVIGRYTHGDLLGRGGMGTV